jgi:hypothetical protein
MDTAMPEGVAVFFYIARMDLFTLMFCGRLHDALF